VFKWDVGDYVACEQGIAAENEVGPVEVLVTAARSARRVAEDDP
jgi:acetoacetyl-CoA reductase